MNDEVLMSDAEGSLPEAEGNDENLGAKLFDGIFGEPTDASASEEVPEDDVDDQVSGDSDEEEVLSDDNDVDEIDEVDEIEEDETDDDHEEFSGDIDVLSIAELGEQVGKIEINGKEYTPAQLKSILGQEESAGTKAREASAKLKEIQEKEAWIEQRMQGVQHSDQMTAIEREARQLNEELKAAREEGDMYEVAVKKDRLEVLQGEYARAKSEVDAINNRIQSEKIENARKGLEERGLGYLNRDGKETASWLEYVRSKGVSDEDLQIAATNPAIAEAFELARKWETANGKTTKKVVSSRKTLKAGTGKKIGSTESKASAERKKRLKAGVGTSADVDSAAMNVAKDILGF